MTAEKNGVLPDPVVKRLTRYLEAVRQRCDGAREWISSQELAVSQGLTSSTVRQDLSYLNVSGISKRGYEILRLRSALEESLGIGSVRNVVIVGAGNLGRALALHGGFGRSGFGIKAVFDSDSRLIGQRIGRLEIMPMTALADTVRSRGVEIGIVAVPGAAAQGVASLLILAGISGILNLSPAHVVAPAGVPVVDVRIVAGLQELLYRMKP